MKRSSVPGARTVSPGPSGSGLLRCASALQAYRVIPDVRSPHVSVAVSPHGLGASNTPCQLYLPFTDLRAIPTIHKSSLIPPPERRYQTGLLGIWVPRSVTVKVPVALGSHRLMNM